VPEGGARRQAASPLLEAASSSVTRMAGAGGASTRAAPRLLLMAARNTASRMGAASCQEEGCTKAVAKAPGSTHCTQCAIDRARVTHHQTWPESPPRRVSD
jgi:hypothetical protein